MITPFYCLEQTDERNKTTSKRSSAPAWPSRRKLLPGSTTEADLIEKYLPLVKTVVGRLAMTLPPHVETEELYSAGLAGLLNAVRQYRPTEGTTFETYARLRIRGAIFDEMRRMDWVPRSVHSKSRKVQSAMGELEQALGRVPTEHEMAKALDMDLDAYQRLLSEIRPATFICLDSAHGAETDDSLSQYESMPDPRQEDPHEEAFRHELADLIANRLQELPKMQRQVLALYYYEDMRLREIAEVFGLTESRICQIHAQAILNIRSHLKKFDPFFE